MLGKAIWRQIKTLRRPGLRPAPRLGSLQRFRKPPSWWGGASCPLPKNPIPTLGPSGLRLSYPHSKISSDAVVHWAGVATFPLDLWQRKHEGRNINLQVHIACHYQVSLYWHARTAKEALGPAPTHNFWLRHCAGTVSKRMDMSKFLTIW